MAVAYFVRDTKFALPKRQAINTKALSVQDLRQGVGRRAQGVGRERSDLVERGAA